MIDSHIHLDADQYDDPDEVIKRARAAGVEAMVVPGVGPASNRKVLALAQNHPGFVFAALGLHPEAFDLTDANLEETVAMIRESRESICAIGETGLPYYGERARLEALRRRGASILERLAQIAVELDLPMILHAPHETAGRALEIIDDSGVRRAVFHWHKSDRETTAAIVAAGYMVSLTPEVAYRDRDREMAQLVPLSNLMVETDGPVPHKGPFSGIRTEPPMVAAAIAAIAEVKGKPIEEVRDTTTRNARSLFRMT
jgi:TatD DNase family protein